MPGQFLWFFDESESEGGGEGTTHHVAASIAAAVSLGSVAPVVVRHATAAVSAATSCGSAAANVVRYSSAAIAASVDFAATQAVVVRHVGASISPSVTIDPISGARTIHVTTGIAASVQVGDASAKTLRHTSTAIAAAISFGDASLRSLHHVATAIAAAVQFGDVDPTSVRHAAGAIDASVTCGSAAANVVRRVATNVAAAVDLSAAQANVVRHVSASLAPGVTIDPISGARTIHVTAGIVASVGLVGSAVVRRHVDTAIGGSILVGPINLYRPGRSFGMGRSITLAVVGSFYARESVDDTISPSSGASGNSRTFDQYGINVQLSGVSEPPVDGDVVDLSCEIPAGGYVDFDLTAAPAARDVGFEEANCTGRRVIGYCIKADRDNDDNLLIAPGASNGYALFGTSRACEFFPGQNVQSVFEEESEPETPLVATGAEPTRLGHRRGFDQFPVGVRYPRRVIKNHD